jgi:lipopolysaccharide assembly outer membrane protein LptD (OstA)
VRNLRLSLTFTFILTLFYDCAYLAAQVETPDKRYLFNEDRVRKIKTQKRKKELAAKRKQAASSKVSKNSDLPFDISASTIDFDTTGSILTAAGNVIISYSSLIAEASEIKVNTKTNEATLSKDVRITDVDANMTAKQAHMNLDSGVGKLEDVSLFFTDGNYRVQAKEVEKLKGEDYQLKDAVLTTCNCPEGEDCRPWSLATGESRIERNGYGQAWNSSLRVYDVPVFYLPYIYFPAKSERQSGLLPVTFGPGRRTGFALQVPYFWAISDSADATLTGIYESKVRTGLDVEVRKLFLGNHTLQIGAVFLDESQRKGRSLGTNVSGFTDPSRDTQRLAGYYNQNWNGKVGLQPFQFIADGHYVSDDLIPREYQRDAIAEQDARFVTSTAVLRSVVTKVR